MSNTNKQNDMPRVPVCLFAGHDVAKALGASSVEFVKRRMKRQGIKGSGVPNAWKVLRLAVSSACYVAMFYERDKCRKQGVPQGVTVADFMRDIAPHILSAFDAWRRECAEYLSLADDLRPDFLRDIKSQVTMQHARTMSAGEEVSA